MIAYEDRSSDGSPPKESTASTSHQGNESKTPTKESPRTGEIPTDFDIPREPRHRPLSDLTHLVSRARVQVATFLFCLTLVACSPDEESRSSSSEKAYHQAEIQYIERSPGGEVDLQLARSLVMMRDHSRLVRDTDNTLENFEQFQREVYRPLQSFVRDNVDRERAKTDPIGAIKEAMYGYISPSLLFNEAFNNMFSPLDRDHPRGQCRACSTLAAVLLLDPEIGMQIPESQVPVFVYTDTHKFLGLFDQDSKEMSTHEFSTRGDSSPLFWGSLEDPSNPKPTMRIATVAAVFDAIVRRSEPEYLFSNVPDTAEENRGNRQPGRGNGPGKTEHIRIPGQDHGELGAFSSGNLNIPSGDRPFPTDPVTSLQSYMGRGGVYATGESSSGGFAQSLSREAQSGPAITSTLEERIERATSVLSSSEKRVFIDFFRYADPLYQIRNQAVDDIKYLNENSGNSARHEQARATVLRLAQEFEDYWQSHNLSELAHRSLSARRAIYDAGWRITDPVAIRGNFAAWCEDVGVRYPVR